MLSVRSAILLSFKSLNKFPIARISTTLKRYDEDAMSKALCIQEADIVPLDQFFLTHEEKERLKICQKHPLKKIPDNEITHINFIPKSYLQQRTARIYKEARHCMQNGLHNSKYWKLHFEVQSKWEHPCIGWISSHDAISSVRLCFHSLAAAQEYCQKNGYDYYVDLPPRHNQYMNTYANNYAWNSRNRVSTK